MHLYDDLSSVYDIVFPENRQATGFLSKSLNPGSRILDLACGTGNYTHALAQKGHTVYGIDLDEKMIQAAKRKYSGESGNFFTSDMLDIDNIFAGYRFDMIFCIGNSLVHLTDRKAVGKLSGKVFDLLVSEGMFIIQIVNYDRIMHYRVDSLPPIERRDEGVTFTRKYAFTDDPDYVYFNTELDCEGRKISNSVKLLALQSKDLIDSVKSAGFSMIYLFGGYDETEHTDSSNATIIKAIK